ncbi:endonuclease I [Chryseobacterium sp. Leaf405]|uniref:endonuclease n=1 Tax=Chryseobacterium sp. Leaf405 TaxID=1736367 RepID=UPI0006FBE5E4|nr:endonuclease [Chryseobacterium sp. Leaf405]KQT23266.1 endonuclease I [Chryseobacterium sp. Leaf405]
MKKFLLPIILISSFISAQIPAGYYDGTTGLTGYALKSKLHDIIAAKNINWNYGDLQNLFNQTDLDRYYDHDTTNTTILLDIYSEKPDGPDSYEYTSSQMIGSAGAEGLGWNREHMIPQSTFSTSSSISDYPMYSDLNFLIPADARINQLRNNYPYGIGGNTNFYNFTNTSRMSNAAIPNYPYTGRVYEPINEFKGDIARTLLYFVVRYEGKLGSFNTAYSTSSTITSATDQCPFDGTEERAVDLPYIEMLKQWSTSDPVSQREIDRNNAVYSIQKNRNPFIDHPEWINMIWSETPDTMAPLVPSSLVSTQQNAHFVNLSWSPSSDTDILGYRIYVNGSITPVATTKNTSISIDHLDPSTTYNFTVKSFDKGYLESPQSNTVTATTLASDSYTSDLMIVKYIEGTGNNKALEIVNKTGHEVNLNNYRINIQLYNNTSGNYYSADTYELEGKVGNNESVVILNPNATLSCYTNDQARFVTASDPMTFSGSQYLELAYNKTVAVDAIGAKFTSNSNANVSLYRKNTTTQPNSTFNISEWDSYTVDYCQNLGTLSTYDAVLAQNNEFKIYPNPVNENIFVTGKTENVKSAQILDFSGKVIYTEKNPFKNKKNISVQSLTAGSYLLKLDDKTYQFIKK